jgi:hypothetical protein
LANDGLILKRKKRLLGLKNVICLKADQNKNYLKNYYMPTFGCTLVQPKKKSLDNNL